mgnify:CR=1 FL=1
MQCLNVVYIVSIAALINISTGINSAIIFYSKYYVLGTVLLVGTLLITILLNIILIPIYGIYGAAIASASGSLIYNFSKFCFIYYKFRFQPYSIKSFIILLLIFACTFIGYILPDVSSNAIINLFIKGSIVSMLYIVSIYQFELSPEIFDMIKSKLIKSKN